MIGDGWEVWSTYRPSDLLLFSARTYRRLFELYNADHRAVNLLLAAGVTVVLLIVAVVDRRTRMTGHTANGTDTNDHAANDGAAPAYAAAARRATPIAALATAALALAWAWIGWAFHLQRYATINWIVPAFAAAFVVQALLLAVRAWRLRHEASEPTAGDGTASTRRRLVARLLLALMILYPLIGLLLGRPASQSEFAGAAPDPTAIATLAMLLFVPASRWLWVIPVTWLALSSSTLLLLDATDAPVPAAAAALAIAGAWRTGRRSG